MILTDTQSRNLSLPNIDDSYPENHFLVKTLAIGTRFDTGIPHSS
jgi:hypothetical protein